MKLKVVGVIAYDSITSEFGSRENVFGGSATYFAISSSYLSNEVRVTGAIGNNFNQLDILFKKGLINPKIHKSFKLRDAPLALSYLLERKNIGKIILES